MSKLEEYDESKTRNLVGVDRHNLEVEVSHISTMVYDYGVLQAEAEDIMDKAKVQWQRARKELANLVRSDPGEYGLMAYGRGPSNDQVYEVVDNNQEVIDLEDAYLDSKFVFNKLAAAIEAFNTKRFSLAWALKLWTKNYYADLPVDDKTRERMIDAQSYEGVYEELAKHAKQRREKNETQS